jgi:ribonuclease BN (tRNA processing enzyme)
MPAIGARRAHPLFLFRYGEKKGEEILFECSSNAAERLSDMDVAPYSIGQVAISHAHPDHYAFQHFVQTAHCHILHRPGFDPGKSDLLPRITLFAHDDIIQAQRSLNAFYFPETANFAEPGLPFPIIRPMICAHKTEAHLVGGARLTSYVVSHGFGRVGALAFRVKLPNGLVVSYSGDTGLCKGVFDVAQNADLFICEAGARVGDAAAGQPGGYGHLNPLQAGEIARQARVKHLVLTHYSGADSSGDMITQVRSTGFGRQLSVAVDGLIIKL